MAAKGQLTRNLTFVFNYLRLKIIQPEVQPLFLIKIDCLLIWINLRYYLKLITFNKKIF